MFLSHSHRLTALLLGLSLAVAIPVQAAKTASSSDQSASIQPAPWPHSYTIDKTPVTFYQPQLDSLEGNTLKGRLAISVNKGSITDKNGKKRAQLDYGVLWFSALIDTNTAARTAQLHDISIDKASFPTAPDKQNDYLALVHKALPQKSLMVNLDQVEASLAINQAENQQVGIAVDNKPPQVIFSLTPALLVLVDGEPVTKPTSIENINRVINTRSLLLEKDSRWYLYFANHWMSAAKLDGNWEPLTTIPDGFEKVMQEAVKAKAVDVMDKPSDVMKKSLAEGKYPTIYTATTPTELITVDGDPQFAPIENTALMYVTNTSGDVFVDSATNNAWYVLLSGRWFTADSTKGPWTYVPGEKLPADFAKIPSLSPKSAVLASIPGTPEAKESLIANSIPQTASVNIQQAKLNVSYDGGKAQFKSIEGTTLQYAVNSALPVIEVNPNLFYAVQNGIWFTAASSTGPWAVALSVPSIIYTIPASSPVHYVTYVHVYGHTTSVVYVGYTPGYYGTVVSNNVVVYGTGYPCNAWVGNVWYGCPATYGYNAAFGYDPYVGWSVGFIAGWAWASAWYGPSWGPWYDWDGPTPWYDGPSVAISNVYGRWGNTVAQGVRTNWSNPWTGNYGTGVRGSFYNQATGTHGYGYAARNTNDYTGIKSGVAGNVRYNPQTGRAVASHGAAIANPDTGNAIGANNRTSVNARTGRVTDSAHVATRTDQGATSARAFNSQGIAGDAHGSGYVHYDASTGQVTHGGHVNTDNGFYAGKDGHVYRYDKGQGWQQVQSNGQLKQVTPPSNSGVDRDQQARTRANQRTEDRSYSSSPDINRDNFQQNRQNRIQDRQNVNQNIGGGRLGGGQFQGGGNRMENVHQFDRGNLSHGFQGRVGGFRHFR
ncbi:hypothetical protein [Limnobaculum parvum]|uniref:hypothetical protein n=1 Tax=Limnobaculum parvum TaxID=2172103 RepID=UPI001864B5C5|nr:hypothetical protein [Limnobaculum parvum]